MVVLLTVVVVACCFCFMSSFLFFISLLVFSHFHVCTAGMQRQNFAYPSCLSWRWSECWSRLLVKWCQVRESRRDWRLHCGNGLLWEGFAGIQHVSLEEGRQTSIK